MKKFILFGLAVLFLTKRNSPTTKKKPPLNAVPNSGVTKNANYWFTFNSPSNPNGEQEFYVSLPSHSRVALPSGEANGNDTANCEYWIYDSQNNVIANMQDNYGGHHPNYFPSSSEYQNQTQSVRNKVAELSANFVAVNPFTTYESKGNNHFDFFRRRMKVGFYKWVIKNNSNLKTNVFAGFSNSEQENVQHNFDIDAGQQQEIYFEVKQHPEGLTADIKLNLNNYRR